jgi:hypothetical protein
MTVHCAPLGSIRDRLLVGLSCSLHLTLTSFGDLVNRREEPSISVQEWWHSSPRHRTGKYHH